MAIQHAGSKAAAGFGALLGAAGVALAAAASHEGAERLLGTAAQMMLVHAPVLVGLGLFGLRSRSLQAAALVLALGVSLFAGDLIFRHFQGVALFPMAAPLGGGTMISGWLILAFAAILTQR